MIDTMIVHEEQFNKFVDILPKLINDEVYFVSLAARNKYLSQEDRTKFQLGRTEMFSREIARDKIGLSLMMKRLRASLQYKTTRNNLSIPESSLVVFANINPSSTMSAYCDFESSMGKELKQVLSYYKNRNGETDVYDFISFKRINRNLMNCIQKATSRRYFIDIDMDNVPDCIYDYFRDCLRQDSNLVYYTIKTRSGFHFLIQKDTLRKEFELYKIVKQADVQAKNIDAKGEVIFNSNAMVPIPGTMQSDHLVVLL